MFVLVACVGPLPTGRWRGLAKLQTPPASCRKCAVVSAQRCRLRWPEHGEVQTREEGHKASTSAWADVADRDEQKVYSNRPLET